MADPTRDPTPDAAPATAFPATARALREAFGDAPLDVPSFARPLAPCDLRDCRGTCCTEGVTLNAEEAMVLRALVRREGDALRALAPAMPAEPIVSVDAPDDVPGDAHDDVHDDDADDRPARTALVPRAYHGVVAGYPPHFRDAACAFLMPDARCALQALADLRGRPSWYWKPLACWLHPIALDGDGIRLPDATTDRHGADGAGGFASCTPCGRTARGGAPAAQVLAPELRALGGLLGRDLRVESGAV
jgi:hypothetical protein